MRSKEDHQHLPDNKKKKKRPTRFIPPIINLPDSDYVKTIRLSKESFKMLVNDLNPHLRQRQRVDGICSEMKVLIALTVFASGSHQGSVAQSVVNVSQKTVSRCVREVTLALNSPDILEKYVKWPSDQESRETIMLKFYQKYGMPGILGCIDGIEVIIIRPSLNEKLFRNKKGYHSINAMIICDSDMNILWVDASNLGLTPDSMVWESHPLGIQLNELVNAGELVFLLGDNRYQLSKTMMTPILNTTEGTPEHYYSLKHLAAYTTVKRCIAVLKARFRCLAAKTALHYDPMTAAKIFTACCVLHNIANNQSIPEDTPAIDISIDEELDPNIRPAKPKGKYLQLSEGLCLQRILIDKLWRNRNILQILENED